MTNKIKINPLDVLQRRRLNSLLPHLHVIPIQYMGKYPIKQWVDEKLKGRYYLNENISVKADKKIEVEEVIAFEDPREATIFLLSCPHLAKS